VWEERQPVGKAPNHMVSRPTHGLTNPMKKNFLIFLLLMPFCLFSQPRKSPVTIRFTSEIEEQQSIIGLKMASIEIVNVSDTVAFVNDLNYLFFEAKVKGGCQWVRFYEGHLISSSGVSRIRLESKDTILLYANLNFLNLLKSRENHIGSEAKLPIEIVFRACIGGVNYAKYYTEEYAIQLHPLNKINQRAFDYLLNNENFLSPCEFSSWSRLSIIGISDETSDSIKVNFPNSSFAELANLALAYKYARAVKHNPEMKTRVQQYLEKPLVSSYDFICYLAEILKEDNYEFKYRSRWTLFPHKPK
jgi:hypothetical protein